MRTSTQITIGTDRARRPDRERHGWRCARLGQREREPVDADDARMRRPEGRPGRASVMTSSVMACGMIRVPSPSGLSMYPNLRHISAGSVDPGRHSIVTSSAPGMLVIQPFRDLTNSFTSAKSSLRVGPNCSAISQRHESADRSPRSEPDR
jgi:hypothetical protein